MTNIHPLETSITPPAQFTDPFDYTPHPLVLLAADEVRKAINSHEDWAADAAHGKMFGVLVVADPSDNRLYYLAAFSGLLNGQRQIEGFVPPVYDALHPKAPHFIEEQAVIDSLSERIGQTEKDDDMTRKHLTKERSERSQQLQQWIFRQYRFSNAKGEEKDAEEVFTQFYLKSMLHPEHYEKNANRHHIPSGAGDCCAPKLLQYAYLMHLKPCCMGEWWMGKSPAGEIRHDGQFYMACMNKCRPILSFMLQGLETEKGPRKIKEQETAEKLKIIGMTEDYIIVNKPSGILSVPGRDGALSVIDIIRSKTGYSCYYPAHRLDQDTSGILIVARTEEAYKNLQRQFQQHLIEKTYTALLDGYVNENTGEVRLPLRADAENRPAQVVDFVHGKQAITRYKVIRHIRLKDQTQATLIEFYPQTGRTHQLRVHSAYHEGLDCPIFGDRLYGKRSLPDGQEQLCLHASRIRFADPSTDEIKEYTCKPLFLEEGN